MTQASHKPSFSLPGYRTIRALGTGAHSSIWELQELATGRQVAVKRVVKQPEDDDRFFEQVRNEYDIARQIDHPAIRKVYKLKSKRKMLTVYELHLFMEYCEGHTLHETPPKAIPEICDLYLQVAYALHAINEAGFVHSDMKPSNIVVSSNDEVKVIDFGQSCAMGTIKERIQGTPDYISPEQVHRWPMDARTDVFNFGASVYWTLTGKPIPTALPRPGEIQSGIVASPIPPIQLNKETPPMLNRLVMDCIHTKPDERPNNMQAVMERLRKVLQKQINESE